MADLNEMLKGMGMDERELIDILQALGDTSQRGTIGQRVRRWRTGATALPGEMVAFLTLLKLVREVAGGLEGILPKGKG